MSRWEKNPHKLNAYADYANACLLPNMQNILNFGNILDKFFITSGLQINKKKTFLVPVGNNETIDVINNAAAQLGISLILTV